MRIGSSCHEDDDDDADDDGLGLLVLTLTLEHTIMFPESKADQIALIYSGMRERDTGCTGQR